MKLTTQAIFREHAAACRRASSQPLLAISPQAAAWPGRNASDTHAALHGLPSDQHSCVTLAAYNASVSLRHPAGWTPFRQTPPSRSWPSSTSRQTHSSSCAWCSCLEAWLAAWRHALHAVHAAERSAMSVEHQLSCSSAIMSRAARAKCWQHARKSCILPVLLHCAACSATPADARQLSPCAFACIALAAVPLAELVLVATML